MKEMNNEENVKEEQFQDDCGDTEAVQYNAEDGRCPNVMFFRHPREYFHNFLFQAQRAGCNVEKHINDEIQILLKELQELQSN